jgi:serine/threonine protein kinase
MSSHEFGCFSCPGKAVSADGLCSECQQPINVSETLLARQIGDYRPVGILGRGYYGWTLKVEDQYQPYALKLIPSHRLASGLTDHEARSLVACSPHRNIARFWRHFEVSVHVNGQDIKAVGLLFEFIDKGQPLKNLLIDASTTLNRKDICDILAGVASGLARMHARGLWHDDLHDDNVLVRLVAPDENLVEAYESKLIDFGSAKPLREDEPEHGEKSDYYYLSKHIYALASRLESGIRVLTPVDRTFASRLRRLAQRLADPQVSRRSLTPSDVVNELRRAYEESAKGHEFPTFEQMRKELKVSLTEPLENTNALNLAPQDIALLFRDSLGWRARLEKSEPVIVIGPRGCGKTMLLRYLSVESQARPLKTESTPTQVRARLEKSPYVAFLVSGGQIRTPFLRSSYKLLEKTDTSRAEDFCREFVNTYFLLESLRTVAWLKDEELADISDGDISALQSTARELLADQPTRMRIGATLEEIIEGAERHIAELSNLRDPAEYSPTKLSRDDVLESLARALKASSWVAHRQVWFLLDDYSVTVLPPFVQRSYNPVLFRLPSAFRLRMSSEGDGPLLEDHFGRKYKEGRELSKVNLGEVYFSATEKDGKVFFEQILEARFSEVGKGSLTELRTLLAEHPNEDGFGEYILRSKRLGDSRFFGFGLLCKLCSGDVSFVIELLHSLTQGRWGQPDRVLKAPQQDEIVKRFAQRQLADLRRISEYGSRLYEFAERVGNLLKQYLVASRGKDHPDERLRIEVEGSAQLCDEAQRMHEALLRNSVLVDGGVGKSRKGLPTRKFYFRRLFAPCFPFSPARKGCIALAIEQYESWLLDPKRIPGVADSNADLFGEGGDDHD